MKNRNLQCMLVLALALAMLFVACTANQSNTPAGGTTGAATGSQTIPPATTRYPQDVAPPQVPAGASKYSGTPDTSWYDESKTEFVLTTADQLVGFQELRSATCTFEGKTVKLACDVVLNEGTVDTFSAGGAGVYAWKLLDPNWFFRGTFDGQGHVISGLYMPSDASDEKAMLGNAGGNAVIKDLTLINSYIGGPNDQRHGLASVVAKIGGTDANVTLSRVVSFAVIESTAGNVWGVGGLVGMIGDGGAATLEDCGFHGSIRIKGYHVGGMLGFVDDSRSDVTMKGCHNSADITADQRAGGLAGTCIGNRVSVTDSGNTGDITAHISDDLCPVFSSLTDPNAGERPDAVDGYTQFRVMSFNVQKNLQLSGGQPSAAGKKRMEGVASEIRLYSPDFLGLQEDIPQWHTYLGAQLSNYERIMDQSVTEEACAIYYKKDLTLLDSGYGWATHDGKSTSAALTVADVTDPNSRYYMTPEERADVSITDSASDGIFRSKIYRYKDEKTGTYKTHSSGYTLATLRRFTWGVFEVNGQQLLYVNTHLTQSSQSASYCSNAFAKVRSLERIKELEIIQKNIDMIKQTYPNAQVVITGDMNDKVGTDIYQAFYSLDYKSAHVDTLNKFGPDASWNNAFNLSVQGGNYPNTAKEGTSRDFLDYCMVSRDVHTLKFVSGQGKAALANGSTVYTSDHLPIIADLCVKNQSTGG